MEVAKAHLEGREPPERRPPCFFDPRHGPSVRDVEWAPPGGEPRPVPVCAADAVRIESGQDPRTREVEVGGRRMPYYDAPGYFAPWAGGYFGGFGLGFGGFLPGLLFGSMLGGGTFGPFGGDGGTEATAATSAGAGATSAAAETSVVGTSAGATSEAAAGTSDRTSRRPAAPGTRPKSRINSW